MFIAAGIVLIVNFFFSLIPYFSAEAANVEFKQSIFLDSPGLACVALAIAILLFVGMAVEKLKPVATGLSFTYAIFLFANSIKIMVANKDVSGFNAFAPVVGLLAGIALVVISIISFLKMSREY